MHLRTLPHFFNPDHWPPLSPEGQPAKVLCLLDPRQLETEMAEFLAFASAAPSYPWLWQLLFLPQAPEILQKACALLERTPHPLPPLEVQVQPLHQWPGLFQRAQACFCFSQDADLGGQQTVMALAMNVPLWRNHALPQELSEIDIPALPASQEDWLQMLSTLRTPAHPPLRDALLKVLQLKHVLSQDSLLSTRMAAVVYWGRSGSVFVQSLLDSHPEILSTPATVLMRFYDFWKQILQTLVEKQAAFELDDFLNLFCQYFYSLFYASPDSSTCCLDQLGPEQKMILEVPVPAFKEAFFWLIQTFFRGEPVSSKLFFIVLHYAYEMAQGRDISEKTLIVYQLHQPTLNPCSQGLFADFPQTRVIGMAREPMRALYSHLRMCRDNRQNAPQEGFSPDYSYTNMVHDGAYLTYYQHQLSGWKALQKQYHPPLYEMQLEALHQNPQKEMQALAQWLEITWHPCLLQSTFNGLEYWGDRRAHQKIQGFSAQHPLSEEWQSCFSHLDKAILYALLKTDIQRLGYPPPSPWVEKLLPLLFFLPTRLEWQVCRQALRKRQWKEMRSALHVVWLRRQASRQRLNGKDI